MSAATQAQEAGGGGDDVLVLNMVCGKYADSPSIDACLGRQNAKADRWMAAIVESHARQGTKDMADLTEMGGHPFDVVAQLRKSQAAFEAYRKETSEWYGQAQFGMTTRLFKGAIYFEITVDRARFLLGKCSHPTVPDPTDKVDLTITEWCR
jgi:hypothetical protein